MKTYLDHIQECTRQANQAYVKIGSLRDAGTANEKDHCNKIRGLLNEVMNELQRYEETVIAAKRYDMKL